MSLTVLGGACAPSTAEAESTRTGLERVASPAPPHQAKPDTSASDAPTADDEGVDASSADAPSEQPDRAVSTTLCHRPSILPIQAAAAKLYGAPNPPSGRVTIVVQLKYAADGSILTVSLRRTSGYASVDRAALDWVRQARLCPQDAAGQGYLPITIDL